MISFSSTLTNFAQPKQQITFKAGLSRSSKLAEKPVLIEEKEPVRIYCHGGRPFPPAWEEEDFEYKCKEPDVIKEKYSKATCYWGEETGNYYDTNKERLFNKAEMKFAGIASGVMSAVVALLLNAGVSALKQSEIFAGDATADNIENVVQDNKEYLDKVISILNPSQIRQDTFSVKDANGDGNPDIVLYKHDDSKILLDVHNKKIQQSVETFKDYDS